MNDYELIMLIQEKNEDAEEILLKRYEEIIKIIIKDYNKIIKCLNIDKKMLENECIDAFYMALNTYSDSMNSSFNSYATLIIRRKIKKHIIKHNRNKNKMLSKSISLNQDDETINLMNLIEDKSNTDPLKQIIESEKQNLITKVMKSDFSNQEEQICLLLLDGLKVKEIASKLNLTQKQVSTTKERIKKKLKNKNVI